MHQHLAAINRSDHTPAPELADFFSQSQKVAQISFVERFIHSNDAIPEPERQSLAEWLSKTPGPWHLDNHGITELTAINGCYDLKIAGKSLFLERALIIAGATSHSPSFTSSFPIEHFLEPDQLYNFLQTSLLTTRRAVFGALVDAIIKLEPGEAHKLYETCMLVYKKLHAENAFTNIDTLRLPDNAGIMNPLNSLSFIAPYQQELVRSSRFFSAIRNAPNPQTVLDAGCGAAAVLGLVAAHFHGATVDAVEIHPNSVIMAREVIKLFGYEDLVKVYESDATAFESDKKYDLIVTETFCSALLNERGIDIVRNINRYLAQNGTMIPDTVTVHAFVLAQNESLDIRDSNRAKIFARLDLKSVNSSTIIGETSLSFLVQKGYIDLYLFAELRDNRGELILGFSDDNAITAPVRVSRYSYSQWVNLALIGQQATVSFSIELIAGGRSSQVKATMSEVSND